MNDEINYTSNPLHGVGLKTVLEELVDHYGFDILYAYLEINCFKSNPCIDSSVKFIKKTDWAREKVEVFYLYEFKNLPRASYEQFQLTPRERIIPEGQVPSEPKVLSFEDAERLRVKRAEKRAERDRERGHSSGGYDSPRNPYSNDQHSRPVEQPWGESSSAQNTATEGKVDPWAKSKDKFEG